MKYAVIDISSSGVSFFAANAKDNDFEIEFKERHTLSLKHYIENGKLLARGIEKLTEALSLVKSKCEALSVAKGWLIATASLRTIENFDDVHKEIAKRTGMSINLIDVKSEAACDVAANSQCVSYESPVLIDMGGASIEICDFTVEGKEDYVCLDFGLDDLTNRFVSKIYPTFEEADEIKEYLKKKLKKAGVPKDGVFSTAVLSGSIMQSIYDVYCDYADIPAVDKSLKVIEPKEFRKLSKHLFDNSKRSMIVLTNAPEKLHVIGTAMVALRTLLKRFNVKKVIVSDYGVKEGYLKLILEGKLSGEPFTVSAASDSEGSEVS